MNPCETAPNCDLVDYPAGIARIHEELGIATDYARRRHLDLQAEATGLVQTDTDLAGRVRCLIPEAASAWQELKAAAAEAGHVLQLVSAFRSVEYQRGIIIRKRERGLAWDDIFRFSAAPGYSEHHTGRAVDLTTPGCPPLEEAFAATSAFQWLQQHAPSLGWRMSYPPDNPHGIAYEPWHWIYQLPNGEAPERVVAS